jgi:hypothetical protein
MKTTSDADHRAQHLLLHRRWSGRLKFAIFVFAMCFAFLGAVGGFHGKRAGLSAAKARGTKVQYFQIYSQVDFVEQHRWVLPVAPAGPSANGWVYGNRLHYQCVYWFLYKDGKAVAKVQYQRANDAQYLKITDKFGAQHPFQPGEECGSTEDYEQNAKPGGLPSTTVTFRSGGTDLNSLLFPSASPSNQNVWFELDDQDPGEVKIEQYRVDTTTALITITRLDPSIDLVVTKN